MPIYEYRCEACGHQEEFLQKVSEPPLTQCPACGKPSLQKLLSAAGFQLKGSGWYVTDFRNKGAKPADKKADAKADAKSADSKPGEGASESKPETKTEPKSEAVS
jgi:putative FmdB family regulatory protein